MIPVFVMSLILSQQNSFKRTGAWNISSAELWLRWNAQSHQIWFKHFVLLNTKGASKVTFLSVLNHWLSWGCSEPALPPLLPYRFGALLVGLCWCEQPWWEVTGISSFLREARGCSCCQKTCVNVGVGDRVVPWLSSCQQGNMSVPFTSRPSPDQSRGRIPRSQRTPAKVLTRFYLSKSINQ